MKTIKQALIDEIHYPIPEGFVDNKLIERELDGSAEYSLSIHNSDNWKGALADCLYSLLQAVNFSEADKSVGSLSDKDKERLLVRINNLYKEIGEDEVEGLPMVYIGG